MSDTENGKHSTPVQLRGCGDCRDIWDADHPDYAASGTCPSCGSLYIVVVTPKVPDA